MCLTPSGVQRPQDRHTAEPRFGYGPHCPCSLSDQRRLSLLHHIPATFVFCSVTPGGSHRPVSLCATMLSELCHQDQLVPVNRLVSICDGSSFLGRNRRDVQMRLCGQTSKSLDVWAGVPCRSWDSSASPQTQSMEDPQLLLHWAAGILLSSSELRCEEDTWGLVQPSREKSGLLHEPHFQAFTSLPHGH